MGDRFSGMRDPLATYTHCDPYTDEELANQTIGSPDGRLIRTLVRLQRERDEARGVARVLAAGIASDCAGMLSEDEIQAAQTALAYPEEEKP